MLHNVKTIYTGSTKKQMRKNLIAECYIHCFKRQALLRWPSLVLFHCRYFFLFSALTRSPSLGESVICFLSFIYSYTYRCIYECKRWIFLASFASSQSKETNILNSEMEEEKRYQLLRAPIPCFVVIRASQSCMRCTSL